MQSTTERLEYLRQELRAERISMGELHELQGLAAHIDPSDVELLEAAGVPEHPEPVPASPELADAWERFQRGGEGAVTATESQRINDWRDEIDLWD